MDIIQFVKDYFMFFFLFFLVIVMIFFLYKSFRLIKWIMFFFKDRRLTKRYQSAVDETTALILSDTLGHVISISGKIGAGKTSLSTALLNALSKLLISKLDNDIEDCKRIIYKLDYNKLERKMNPYIESDYHQYFHQEFVKIPEIIDILDIPYDSGTRHTTYSDILYKYVRAYFRINQGDYVLSNFKFKSQITGLHNRVFENEFLAIKDGITPITKGLIIGIDEKAIDKNNTMDRIIKASDTGEDTFYRLLRNGGEGLMYLVWTSQNYSRVVKLEREITNTNIYIKGTKEITINIFRIARILNKLNTLKRLMFVFRIFSFRWSRNSWKKYTNRPNIFKKSIYKYVESLNELETNNIIKFTVNIIKNVSDSRADKFKNKEAIDLYFKKAEVYDSMNTYEYAEFFDYIMNSTKLRYEDLPLYDHQTDSDKENRYQRILEKNAAKIERITNIGNHSDKLNDDAKKILRDFLVKVMTKSEEIEHNDIKVIEVIDKNPEKNI